MPKVVVIIQARMGATRLPGKMMMDLAGKPVIERVVERVKLSSLINEIWIATTVNPEDNVLADWAQKNKINSFRGSSDDVLDRYHETAKFAGADTVVRITGDCPLIDPCLIDEVIAGFLSGDNDYASNTHPPTFPDGLDVEVFSFKALERAWQEAELKSEREHVTAFIWNHSEKFKLKNIVNKKNYSSERWTLDTKEDMEFIERVVKVCQDHGDSVLSWIAILDIINQHPEWRGLNSRYGRNEGYFKSLAED